MFLSSFSSPLLLDKGKAGVARFLSGFGWVLEFHQPMSGAARFLFCATGSQGCVGYLSPSHSHLTPEMEAGYAKARYAATVRLSHDRGLYPMMMCRVMHDVMMNW